MLLVGLYCHLCHLANCVSQVDGLVEPGSTVQKAADVIWWPTLFAYKNSKKTWLGKVPNPPSLEAIQGLSKHLDELDS